MPLSPAAWHATAAIAQPQSACNRRGNGPGSTSHIQEFPVIAHHHIDSAAITREHACDVQRHGCAVGQETADASGAVLELFGCGDDDELVAGAERAGAML